MIRTIRNLFKQGNSSTNKSTKLSGEEPLMSIELTENKNDLQKLFDHIQASWHKLGETEPYWSVLTNEKFLMTNMNKEHAIDRFYDTGKGHLARIFKALERNGFSKASIKNCLEYGCGLGRVTLWLANNFDVVYGYDISRSHLQCAENYLKEKGIRNVTFHHITKVSDLESLPNVDLIYSFIVLQHNPPPVIAYIIRHFLKALNAGGFAIFQVPTYRMGYMFSLKDYLSGKGQHDGVEMHVLPQSQIFDIITQEGCKLIEVIEDNATGQYKEISNSFLIGKM